LRPPMDAKVPETKGGTAGEGSPLRKEGGGFFYRREERAGLGENEAKRSYGSGAVNTNRGSAR
jgi:hypothetical protein